MTKRIMGWALFCIVCFMVTYAQGSPLDGTYTGIAYQAGIERPVSFIVSSNGTIYNTFSYQTSVSCASYVTINVSSPSGWPISGDNLSFSTTASVCGGFNNMVIEFNGTYSNYTFSGNWYKNGTLQGTWSAQVPPVSIVTHPSDQSVLVGDTATFSLVAIGVDLTYQWQKNDVDIPGATSATYTTPPLSLTDNGAVYRCVVANNDGSATSDQAILTVDIVDHFDFEAIYDHQVVDLPFSVTIYAKDSADLTATDFNGTVNISGIIEGSSSGEITIGTGTGSWNFPMDTYYHDARTQVIYLANELGGAKTLTSLFLEITTIPGQTMNNWTIRMKRTGLSSYPSSPSWEGDGWTTVYQNNESISSTGWKEFIFTTPFEYNGTDNLMIDFSFNNQGYTSDGYCRYTDSGQDRSLWYNTDSGYGDPLTWSGSNSPSPSKSYLIPNIKIKTKRITPEISGNFINGIWTGDITVLEPADDMFLRVEDNTEHSGVSNTFDVNTCAIIHYYADADGDGYGNPEALLEECTQPEGYMEDNTDCDDTDTNKHPGQTWYADTDGDGNGDPNDTVQQCTQPEDYVLANSDHCPTDPNKVDPGVCGCGTPDIDSEPDGMLDCWEEANSLDPFVNDANEDTDEDGFSNLQEYRRETDPQDPDSHPSRSMPWLPLLLE